MKTFKQHIKEGHMQSKYGAGQVGSTTSVSPEDSNMGAHNIENPEVLKKVNAFVGAIANQNYELPEQAISNLREKLMRVGLEFGTVPAMSENKGSFSLPLSLFGGRFGKDENTPFNEFLNDDGISNKVEGGLKLELSYEMQENNACKITASIK